jgi:hypothetical protein
MSERKVSFAINVNTAQELAEAGPHVKSFLQTVEADDFDISVAVNPLIELAARERPPAIGFIQPTEGEDYEEEDE